MARNYYKKEFENIKSHKTKVFAKCMVGRTKEVQMFFKNCFCKYIFFIYPSLLMKKALWSQGSEAYNLHILLLPIPLCILNYLLVLSNLLNSLKTTAIKERTWALKPNTAGLKSLLLGCSWVSKLCNFVDCQYSHL